MIEHLPNAKDLNPKKERKVFYFGRLRGQKIEAVWLDFSRLPPYINFMTFWRA